MKELPFALDQIALVLVTACGFAGSTWAFRTALDTNDHRRLLAAIALLILSYIPYLSLLGRSMSGAIVATGMMSQALALAIAFAVYGEPITPLRAFGLAAALIATLVFAIPVSTKS